MMRLAVCSMSDSDAAAPPPAAAALDDAPTPPPGPVDDRASALPAANAGADATCRDACAALVASSLARYCA